MLTIRITEFEGYGLTEFMLFLEEAEDNIYEIVVPKQTTTFSTGIDIAWEFYAAAYIGQCLSQISTKFWYVMAKPALAGQFSFKITTRKIDKLATVLLQTSGAFGNSEQVKPDEFASAVNGFIINIKNRRASCQDMLDIANEYHSETGD